MALGVVAAATTAPLKAADRYDPKLKFRTIRTAHFDVHAHQGEELLAARLAAIAERVRARFQPVFGVPRGRVQVILVDQTDLSNGWATPYPYDAIEITAVQPASETILGHTTDWLEVAFTHEYTHILHLDRSRGFIGAVRGIFGRAPEVFPNSYLPVWQIEGLAVFEESHMTGEGRVPAGDFRAIVDTAAAHGRFAPIDRASGGLDDWPAGDAPYAYGAYFHQYLADRYGAERLSQLADATAGRLPLFGAGAFTHVFGRSESDLWSDFRASREHAAAPQSQTDARATRLTHHGFTVDAPRATENGTIYYGISNADGFPALMALDPAGTPRRVAWRVLGTRTSVGHGWILFDQLEDVRSIALYSDLYAVREAGGHPIRLTREARAADPDLSPDGREIVCTVQATGHRALAQLEFDPAAPRAAAPRILVDDPGADFTGPRWSPDGRSIVVERRRAGRYDLVLVDPATASIRVLLSKDDARLVTPSWTRDGQTILFAADPGPAVFNIFSVDVASSVVHQVTDTLAGAQFPEILPSGALLYVGYTPDGYDLFSVPTDPATWPGTRFEHANSTNPNPPNPNPANPENPGNPVNLSRYQPLRTLTPTYWEPEVLSDGGETLVGAGTLMYDALGRHTYAADAAWSGARARPDWHASYAYDRWRPTLFTAYSDNTDPLRGGEIRTREFTAGALLPFRHVRWSETLMGGFHAEHDAVTCQATCVFRDQSLDLRAMRAGWLHDSRRQYGYSISTEEGSTVETAVEASRTALGSDTDASALVVDARGFHRAFGPHTVLAARVALAAAFGPEDGRRIFSAAGPVAAPSTFDFGRDTIGLLRGFQPEDVEGTRAAVVNLDLRTPLARIERGAGTWPVFLRSVHGAAFVDAGSAWDTSFRARDIRSSVGGELSFDLVLVHYFSVTLATGAAWTRDPVADANRAAFFGRVGYAF